MKHTPGKFSLLFVLFISAASFAFGQYGTFTPYSQIGIGVPATVGLQQGFAMGSVISPLRSNSFINYYNPASYSAFGNTLFQFGLDITHQVQTRGTASQSGDLAHINQINLGVPIIKDKLGLSFGFNPYSHVSYSLSRNDKVVSGSDTLNVEYKFDGNGGVDKIYAGMGWRIFKGFSAGFNAAVYLGGISKTKAALYETGFGGLNSRRRSYDRMADINFDFGLQYQFKIKKVDVILGATYQLGKAMTTKNITTIESFLGTLDDAKFSVDTIIANQKLKVNLPNKIGGGIAVGKMNHWLLSTDINFADWGSGFRYNGNTIPFYRNSMQYSFGAEFTPLDKGKKGFFNYTTYRIGGRFNQSYLNPDGNPYTEIGISFGLGIPILTNALIDRKLRSAINLAFEYSKMQNANINYTHQDTYKIVVSINLKDKWFLSRKYN